MLGLTGCFERFAVQHQGKSPEGVDAHRPWPPLDIRARRNESSLVNEQFDVFGFDAAGQCVRTQPGHHFRQPDGAIEQTTSASGGESLGKNRQGLFVLAVQAQGIGFEQQSVETQNPIVWRTHPGCCLLGDRNRPLGFAAFGKGAGIGAKGANHRTDAGQFPDDLHRFPGVFQRRARTFPQQRQPG